MKEVLERLRDVFGDVAIGGSTARNTYEEGELTPGKDIDVYIKNPRMTSWVIEGIIRKIVFKDDWSATEDRSIKIGQYPNSDIRRQFKYMSNNVVFDFIFVDCKDVANWVINPRNQASALSQVALELNFSPKGYSLLATKEFNKVMEAIKEDEKGVEIRVGRCTPEHLEKILKVLENTKCKIILD